LRQPPNRTYTTHLTRLLHTHPTTTLQHVLAPLLVLPSDDFQRVPASWAETVSRSIKKVGGGGRFVGWVVEGYREGWSPLWGEEMVSVLQGGMVGGGGGGEVEDVVRCVGVFGEETRRGSRRFAMAVVSVCRWILSQQEKQ
ncbi:hypothetical protein HDU67_004127, partial [Dinochytrium kinnereticum]